MSGKTGYTTPCTQVYVVVDYTEAATGTNMKINIGDDFKDVSEIKINIGDVWKIASSIKQNIGDSWKTVY